MKNKKHKRQKVAEASGGFYLTLVSIIQSLALGLLLENTILELKNKPPVGDYWIRFAVTFLIIVLVWHEYALGASLYNWNLDLADSLVPFALAVSEYMVIESSRSYVRDRFGSVPDPWVISLVIFLVITLMAYFNQYRKVILNPNDNVSIPSTKARLVDSLITVVGMLLLLFLGEYVQFLRDCAPHIILGIVVVHCIRIEISWKRVMSNQAL